ncbi:MAG TPA: exodeoxyribonuclease VII large subunit [Candidatus Baltobacteraceae bacterium]|nr:exodeoxyribonuclease VII large subunit [Candidatus Baltobacteraceae bacterium]
MFQDSLFSQRPQPAPASAPAESIQGVSRVVDYIRRIISQNKTLAGIRVRGEVSGFSNKNGRLYFDLKENSDVLKCVVWASDAQKLPPFKDGDEIICGGDYGTFVQRSQYQLFVKSVDLTGIGALYAQFEALKEQFRKEGLFEEGRKRPMPAFPRKIAVVSARGKGAEDFLATIAKRAPFVEVQFVETRVQGDGAQMDIAEAIDKASRLDVDVIVLTRGGGGYEDLFPFNLEPVVRAIVRAKHPVLSAVGHTGDVHVSDYVADYACETPSNAAQYFGEIGDRFLQRVQRAQSRIEHMASSILTARAQAFDYTHTRLASGVRRYVQERERSLHGLERRLNTQTPHRRLGERAQRITALRSRLEAAARYYAAPRREGAQRLTDRLSRLQTTVLRPYRDRLSHWDTRLGGLDPHKLLARGYAIVTLDGHAVRDAAAVPQGALIEAQLQRGKLLARVERKDSDG